MGRVKPMRDKRTRGHVSVLDAAQVIALAREMGQMERDKRANEGQRWGAAVTNRALRCWDASPVVLRVDMDFANVLLGSDTDVELIDDWLERLPFDTVAFSFDVPISLHDGMHLCHYAGCIVVGIKPEQVYSSRGEVYTTYHPFTKSDGMKFIWLYQEDGSPGANAQSVTLSIKGLLSENRPRTLTDFIEQRLEMAREHKYGDELPTLVALGAQLMLYLAAQDPDLEWPAPETISRPQQLANAEIGQLGWRVGAAVRRFRQDANGGVKEPGGIGWRLPPHIRKAHWTRVRVATRDESGAIVGDRLGVQHVDWHYEARWLPPTLINAGPSGKVAPAVRAVVQECE